MINFFFYRSLAIASILFMLSIAHTSYAQDLSNFKKKQIVLTPALDTIQIDTLSIVPGSLNVAIEQDFFVINYEQALFIEVKPIAQEELTVSYRVFPYSFANRNTGINQHKDAKKDSLGFDDFYIMGNNDEDELFNFGDLQVQGGLTRGLNFGNAQNLVVNSKLDLLLSGTVANDIQIKGVLTDDNVPFQPQGNSRQIQELDQVYLQFTKQNHQVTLGDYEQTMPESYFLVYNKRLQGVNYSSTFGQADKWNGSANVSGAASRGKYTQNTFTGQEGNQGPYKLFGANNESFIIILAGTERVFIDGVRMERGEDRDYVIDYNVGEISFTNRKFITNRSRISVEFEYTNQSYNSTFLSSEATYGKDKLNFRLNFYTEQDGKQRATLADTTINTGGLFTNLGDNIDNFFIDSFQESSSSEGAVRYELQENVSIGGQVFDTIFVASTDDSQLLYSVRFTYVGPGQGNYRLQNQIINGRIYEFIAPVNGVPQGDYVPKLRVVPPRAQQLIALTTEYKISKNQELSIETAFSNRDLNTLSTIGNEDNTGLASKLSWSSAFHIGDTLKNRTLTTQVNYELKGSQFRSIERYRPVEFSRDWNLSAEPTDSLMEHYMNASVFYKTKNNQQLNYTFSSFFQENKKYTGQKHVASYNYNHNGNMASLSIDYLAANEQQVNSNFFRPRFSLAKKTSLLNGLTMGVTGREDTRSFENIATGLLDNRSIGDRDLRFFVESSDTSTIYTKFAIGKRYDYAPDQTNLSQVFETNVIEAEGRLNKLQNHQLTWNFTFRDLEVLRNDLTEDQNKLSFLGRMNYTTTLAKGIIRTGFDYEVGAGQEPRREFSYVAVAPGEGVYTWIDYNDNGLQEITEFEVAPFSDQAEYVRVFTSSNEYVTANTSRINQWINIDPVAAWRNENGIKNTLAKFNINSNLTLNRRLFENSSVSKFNPYVFSIQDDGLLSALNQLTNRLFYNRLSNTFRATAIHELRNSRSFLLSGIEERDQKKYVLQTDIYFKDKFSIQNEIFYGNQLFLSENYQNRNFNFDRISVKPKANYIANNKNNSYRFGLAYAYFTAENQAQFGGENATNHSALFDFTYNKRKQFSLKGNIDYNSVDFSGESNSAVKFSMLNGLQENTNVLWNLSFEREIAKAIKVNLTYNGRSLGEIAPVHTGRATVTAIF